jgi:hypothetical protein
MDGGRQLRCEAKPSGGQHRGMGPHLSLRMAVVPLSASSPSFGMVTHAEPRWRNVSVVHSVLACGDQFCTNWRHSRAHSQPAPAGDEYFTRIQPIFDNRCVACHSCFNAPCQLNLQSYLGLTRGATKLSVYDGLRPKSVAPTRLEIDGRSISDWRAKSFFDVVGGDDPARSLLMQLVNLRAQHPTQPRKPAGESNFCPADTNAPSICGAQGPSTASLTSRRAVPARLQSEARAWEALFNGTTPREKLVARYLYEHLFLAHLYFTSETASGRPTFFRLVRSHTPCGLDIDEIATRRRNRCPRSTRAAEPLLILPGIWGSDVQFSDDIPFLRASSNSAKRIESSGRTTPVSAPIGAPATANPRLPSQKPESLASI